MLILPALGLNTHLWILCLVILELASLYHMQDLAADQSSSTILTDKAIDKLLDYYSTYPNPSILYKASEMILHIDSDASYLSLSQARSRAAGYYFLSEASSNPLLPPQAQPTPNGPIYILCKRMRNVLASTAESELAALFHNGQEAAVLRQILLEMGHPQPPTPIKTDNSTTDGIANRSVIPRKTRMFLIYWKPGKENLADYFSKHHPPTHHQRVRPDYVIINK